MGVLHVWKLEGKIVSVNNEFVRRENGNDDRSEVRAASEQDSHDRRFQPSTVRIYGRLDHNCARSQQHGINRRQIVILPMQGEVDTVGDKITPSQNAIRFQTRGKEEYSQTGDPNGRGEWMHEKRLLEEVLSCGKHNVAALGPDVAHQFEERPVVVHVPEQVRQKYEECCQATQPNPLVQEDATLFGQEQANDDSKAK